MGFLHDDVLFKLQNKIQADGIAYTGAKIKAVFSLFQNPGTLTDFSQIIKRSKIGSRNAQEHRCGLSRIEERRLAEGFQFPDRFSESSLRCTAVELNDFLACKSADIGHLHLHFKAGGIVTFKDRPER